MAAMLEGWNNETVLHENRSYFPGERKWIVFALLHGGNDVTLKCSTGIWSTSKISMTLSACLSDGRYVIRNLHVLSVWIEPTLVQIIKWTLQGSSGIPLLFSLGKNNIAIIVVAIRRRPYHLATVQYPPYISASKYHFCRHAILSIAWSRCII